MEQTRRCSPDADSPSSRLTGLLPSPFAVDPDRCIFRFLDLPGELRNAIYELSIPHAKTRLPPAPYHQPYSTSPLMRVCQQIRAEFIPRLYSSPSIHATINNFKFNQLINFITNVTQNQALQLKAASTTLFIKLKLEMVLILPDIEPEEASEELSRVTEWVTVLANPAGKAQHLKISYEPCAALTRTLQEWVDEIGQWIFKREERSAEAGIKELRVLHEAVHAASEMGPD